MVVVGRTVLAAPAADLTPAEREACRIDIVSLEGARASRGGHPEVRDALIASGESAVAACMAREKQQEIYRQTLDAKVEADQAQRDEARRAGMEKKALRVKKAEGERLERDRIALLVEDGRADRGIQQVVQSWNLCAGQTARKEALDGIAEEKRYAKKVGVTNLGKLESLKGDLMDADQDIASARQILGAVKAKPMSCGDARITALIDCLNAQSSPDVPLACAKDSMIVSMALARGN